MLKHLMVATALLGSSASFAIAENRIDRIRPDAPELAKHGDLAIGVRTIELSIQIRSTSSTSRPASRIRAMTAR